MHWTQALQNERARLESALEYATAQLRALGRGRLAKEQKFPHSDAEVGMAYATCAQEVILRGDEAADRAWDIAMGAE